MIVTKKILYSEIKNYPKNAKFEYIVLDVPDYEERYLPYIKEIGNQCFYHEKIRKAYFPNVIYIREAAFIGCSYLKYLYIPKTKFINDYAFLGCDSLKSIYAPNVTNIGESAFEKCTSLTSISFPNLSILNKASFCDCESLKSIDLPIIKEISRNAFQGCMNLCSANIPEVTTIESFGFSTCDFENIYLPNVIHVEPFAFAWNLRLKSAKFPNAAYKENIFHYCNKLTTIEFME